MIVYVIGGHGSGKTTAVRKLMSGRQMVPQYRGDRGRPIGYADDEIFVAGQYEIKNGGTDSVRPLSELVRLMRLWSRSRLVIGEGVGQAGFARELINMQLHAKIRVDVLLMHTSLEECARSVWERGHSLSLEGIRRSWQRSRNAADEMRAAGLSVCGVSRQTILRKMRELTCC